MKLPALLAAGLAIVLLAAPAQAAPEDIAVVDMVELITKHPRATELQKKLEQRQQEAERYADAEQSRLRKLKEQIDLTNANNPQRRTLEKEFLTGSSMLKLEIEWRKDQALREYMNGLESLYAEIQALVLKYARTHGIKLVLLKSDADLRAADFNDYAAKVQLRTVVFSEPSLDITDYIRAMFMPRAPQPGRQPPGAPPAAPPAGPGRPR